MTATDLVLILVVCYSD